MDNLREILVSEITGLKSLLRLNADGVGDDDDLVAQLTRTRISLEKFSTELLGSTRSTDVITPDTLPSSVSSSPTRSSLNSNRSSATTTAASLDDCTLSGGVNGGGLEEDDAFLRLSSLLAGLQAQAEAAVSSGFSTSAPTTPLVRTFVDSDSNSSTDGDSAITPGVLGSNGEFRQKCELTRTHSLPHPFLAPAPRRLRKAASTGISLREETASAAAANSAKDQSHPTVNVTLALDSPLWAGAGGDTGRPPTLPPALRRRGKPEDRHRPTLSDVFDVPSPAPTTPDRRNSLLPKELEIEGLLTEFLEDREKAETGFRWVWVYLLGGGIVWALVGWLLRWGCVECAARLGR
ncbi:hypothetical protein L873DRAFT_1703895 [Choiromyces venosus 120613-1]|uniref:Uncharacterized protein n=1 Tax=Choiromyces venosus 120613-1 TaxID=1336337 RepID=A0A3N4J5Y1_9PEZI|nr:hypothetical protein L873DRAFT_1703895 [Choiromyces venosus 120613-1]